MASAIKMNDNVVYNVNEYLCSSVDELAQLTSCAPGSTAIILEEKNMAIYMKNTKGEWVRL